MKKGDLSFHRNKEGRKKRKKGKRKEEKEKKRRKKGEGKGYNLVVPGHVAAPTARGGTIGYR